MYTEFHPNTTTNLGNNTHQYRWWCCSSNCCVSIFHMLGLYSLHMKFLSGWFCPTQWLQLPTQSINLFVKLSLQKFIFHGIQEFNNVSKKTHLTLSLTTPIQFTHSTPMIKSPFQLTLLSNPRYLKWAFFKIPHKNRVHNFKVPHAHYMCHPSLSFAFIILMKPSNDYKLCILLFLSLLPFKSNYSVQYFNFKHLPFI